MLAAVIYHPKEDCAKTRGGNYLYDATVIATGEVFFICSRSGLIPGREITVLCCILRRVSLDQGAPIFFEIDPDIMKTQRVLITENRKHLHISRVNNVFSFFNKKYIISKLAK